jgi:hypothetical protein
LHPPEHGPSPKNQSFVFIASKIHLKKAAVATAKQKHRNRQSYKAKRNEKFN